MDIRPPASAAGSRSGRAGILALLVALLPALAVLAPMRAAAARPPSILDDARFRADVKTGLDRLYAMDFPAAGATFAAIARRHPGHPVGPFLRGLVPWWNILADPDDESRDEAFLEVMDEVIELCNERLDKNPHDMDAQFFKTGAHAFRGRLHSFRGHWYRAARDGQMALKYLRKVSAKDPGNDDLYLGLGLFDYLADVVPRRHPFLKPLAALFPKGNRARGLAELERARTRGVFVGTEAAYARLLVDYSFEQDMAACLRDLAWLRRRHPGNSVFHLFEARVLARAQQWDRALHVYREIGARHAARRPGYGDAMGQQALYGVARSEMALGRYAEALPHLARLEALSRRRPESEVRALGKLRQGMAYDALGRRGEAVRCYREVLAMEAPRDARSRARGFLSQPYAG